MSLGNKPLIVRLTPELWHAIDVELELAAKHRRGAEWSVSDFVRELIVRGLAHRRRARRRKPKAAPPE